MHARGRDRDGKPLVVLAEWKELKEATRSTDGGSRMCNGIDELKILDPGPREGLVCGWRLRRSSDEKNKKTSVEDPEVMTRALRYGTWHWVD